MTTSVLRYAILFLALGGLLSGCATNRPAPVTDRSAKPATPATASSSTASPGEFHTVKKGETLYSIALEYGRSYQDVAAWNSIDNPAMISVGQRLRVAPPEEASVVKPVADPAAVETRPLSTSSSASPPSNDGVKRAPKGGKEPYTEQAAAKTEPKPAAMTAPAAGELNWMWPSGGKVIATYVEGGNKGVDIEGKIGDAVLAAEAGKVTYAGSGIRGYGNLLIVHHAGGLLSVYAHNSKLLAKEGQQVSRGQKIAELGDSDAERAKLHFEIRRQGKPIDPLPLLPPR
ncbi:MAG: peptidoglycan DD-metalloendopeptidase family protein [Zoogloeaceae bacterium]|jgi:lipoprotein NlpD|nr:peptidoglycan DD-metalloendopeptidase family protein [Zoogloeaceae bacterium]